MWKNKFLIDLYFYLQRERRPSTFKFFFNDYYIRYIAYITTYRFNQFDYFIFFFMRKLRLGQALRKIRNTASLYLSCSLVSFRIYAGLYSNNPGISQFFCYCSQLITDNWVLLSSVDTLVHLPTGLFKFYVYIFLSATANRIDLLGWGSHRGPFCDQSCSRSPCALIL